MSDHPVPRSPSPLRVLLADDHDLFLDAFALLLTGSIEGRQLQVVGVARNGAEAITEALRLHPDLLLLDVLMPVMKGSDAVYEIRRRRPKSRILMLSSSDAPAEIREARAKGADGYVHKSCSREQLYRAIAQVMRGEQVFGATPGVAETQTPHLTHREQQVLKLVVEGRKTREIAELLHLSPRTIDKYRATLKQKFAVDSAAQLAAIAARFGLLD